MCASQAARSALTGYIEFVATFIASFLSSLASEAQKHKGFPRIPEVGAGLTEDLERLENCDVSEQNGPPIQTHVMPQGTRLVICERYCCMCMHICVCSHTYTHIRTHICTYACISCMHMQIQTYIHRHYTVYVVRTSNIHASTHMQHASFIFTHIHNTYRNTLHMYTHLCSNQVAPTTLGNPVPSVQSPAATAVQQQINHRSSSCRSSPAYACPARATGAGGRILHRMGLRPAGPVLHHLRQAGP